MSTLQPLSRFGNAAMECQFWLIFPLIWSSVWYWFLLYFVFIKCITIDLSSLLKHITAFAMVHSSVYWRRLKDWQEFFDWQQWLSLWAELSTVEKFSSKYIWWEFSITSVSSCPSNDQKIASNCTCSKCLRFGLCYRRSALVEVLAFIYFSRSSKWCHRHQGQRLRVAWVWVLAEEVWVWAELVSLHLAWALPKSTDGQWPFSTKMLRPFLKGKLVSS